MFVLFCPVCNFVDPISQLLCSLWRILDRKLSHQGGPENISIRIRPLFALGVIQITESIRGTLNSVIGFNEQFCSVLNERHLSYHLDTEHTKMSPKLTLSAVQLIAPPGVFCL